ncbi:MAG: 30S ribosomal protein S17 [Verrucomicrobiota bacterium]
MSETATETPTSEEPTVETEASPTAAETATSEKVSGLRKTRVGVVTSTGMQKTIAVEVTRRVPHPRFKKIVKKSSKFFAHDEGEEAAVGDRVLIEETKPISKRKCWTLKEVLSH